MINDLDSTPWYRQFWPWFIIALPSCVVLASFVTLFIAVTNRDSLVKDNYYKEGLAINTDLREVKLAKDLGLKATITTNRESKMIKLVLESSQQLPPARMLLLKFIHPFDEKLDLELALQQYGVTSSDQQTYQQRYYNIETLNWNLEITPLYIEEHNERHARWKINTRFNPSTAVFTVDNQ